VVALTGTWQGEPTARHPVGTILIVIDTNLK
jgi:hypothetical protein